MDQMLSELRVECRRAADEFLAVENWGSAKARARDALDEMIKGSQRSTAALAWLIRQTTKLPVQNEPARRLHEFVLAVQALRSREAQLANLSDDAPDFCTSSGACRIL